MILEKIPRDEEKESSSTSRNLVFFVVIFLAAGGLSFLLLEIFLAPEPKKTHYLLGARDSFLRKPACRWGSLGRRERILISSTTNQPPYVFIWYKIWSGGWWKGKRPLPHCHQTPLGKGIELWVMAFGAFSQGLFLSFPSFLNRARQEEPYERKRNWWHQVLEWADMEVPSESFHRSSWDY